MRSVIGLKAPRPLVASTVGVTVTTIVTGTVVAVAGAPKDPVDTIATLGVMLAGGLGFTVVGSLILVRQPGHRIGWLMLLMGTSLVLSFGVQVILDAVAPSGSPWTDITGALRAVAESGFSAFALLGGVLIVAWFPDGRTTSRLGTVTQALVLVLLAGQFVMLLDPRVLGQSPLPFVLITVAYATALTDLVVRYRHSDGVRRTQIRWVLASGALTASLVVAVLTVGDRVEWVWPLWLASTMLPPMAIGIAITRYHLYDIDRIVSRTIAYAAVSVILFAVYFGTNILLQNVISPLVNGNVIATAASTLLVAGLFQPVRRRIQRAVDRRFHRARHDADRLVDVFAGRLRESVDLPRLVGELRRTAGEAVEPTTATVWLRGARP